MRTYFGDIMRVLRISKNEKLMDTAIVLEITAAELSAAETGNACPPDEWIDLICAHYQLGDEWKTILRKIIELDKRNADRYGQFKELKELIDHNGATTQPRMEYMEGTDNSRHQNI